VQIVGFFWCVSWLYIDPRFRGNGTNALQVQLQEMQGLMPMFRVRADRATDSCRVLGGEMYCWAGQHAHCHPVWADNQIMRGNKPQVSSGSAIIIHSPLQISWNDLLHQGQTADVSIIRAKTGWYSPDTLMGGLVWFDKIFQACQGPKAFLAYEWG
jgi:hypothetical protein